MLRNVIILVSFLIYHQNTYALKFNQAVDKIANHPQLELLHAEVLALKQKATIKGSWGDPNLKIAAKNFPQDNLTNDQSPMTGVEIGLSQKMALSNKYGHIEKSIQAQARAKDSNHKKKQQKLIKILWEALIEIKRIKEEIKINNENLLWIKKNIRISKKLYSNGQLSQQSYLDIQIRKSQLESQIDSLNFQLKQNHNQISYLTGTSETLALNTVPWNILKQAQKNKKDYVKESLINKVKALEHESTAQKLNYIPDITFSVSVTKRSNIDNNGDFVSAGISFPLPTSSTKYSQENETLQRKRKTILALKDYEYYKSSQLKHLDLSIKKIKNQLKILKNKSLKFAQSAREITSKSYSLGQASYLELVQSEVKLQELLLQKSNLEAKLANMNLSFKFLQGENLNG